MKQYQSFIFDACAFDPETGIITLTYSLDDDITFKERLTLPMESLRSSDDAPSLGNALRALHLMGGISYYKTCLPKTMTIRTGNLSPEEAAFWNTVYENGLGEFFFRNNIDFNGLIHFPANQQPVPSTQQPPEAPIENRAKRVLVPVGGGKDSMVTVELLKKAGFDCTLLRLGKHPLIDRLAEEAGLPLLTVNRSLPKELFELNAAGALNGHVPITAYLSFVAVIVAILGDFDAVVLSNERSASFGNVSYHGKEINHQWSKGIAFERMMQDYLRSFVKTDISCFSLLRPLSELHIAKLFAQFPRYLPLTTSCNKNWKIRARESAPLPPGEGRGGEGNLWCGKCPKCAFVFSLLAAFVPKKTLLQTFGKNLYTDAALLPLYRELWGIEGMKPFECVGTPDEAKAAFLLAMEHKEYDHDPVMQAFKKDVLPSIPDPKKLIDEILTPSADHCVPVPFSKLITER
ncbi:MAG: hypothetical protein PHW10_00920 [Candidatus Peribacteraceae bacterium]|nr:hypothetical protein [Candidatus Peribacteraceae bacterium]